MAQATTRKEEGIEIASDMAGNETEVEFWQERDGSGDLVFEYENGCIHTCKLPDDWEMAGFGSTWFALKQE